MKPIDVIRKKLDPDLLKYHHSTLCVIPTEADITDVRACGLLAMVVPLNEYNAYTDSTIFNAAVASPTIAAGAALASKSAKNLVVSGPSALGASMNDKSQTQTYDGKSQSFPVVVVNRAPGEREKDIASKYYVLVFNPVQDRLSLSVGFLVPKTMITDNEAWINSRMNPDKAMSDTEGRSVKARTIEMNSKGDM